MVEKWINIERDEQFQRLIYEIKGNCSPAVINVDWRLDILLREHGYEWARHERRIQERVVKAVDSSKIVSKGRTPISEELIAEIKQMRLDGHSVRSIAKIKRVSVGTVGKYIKTDT